jgi:predicted RNA methylase
MTQGELWPDAVPRTEDGRDPALSQWWTPPELASRIVAWAGVKPGMCVLEPAAGSGHLVAPILSAGAEVAAYEIDRHWFDTLRALGPDERLAVIRADFLAAKPIEAFHMAVTNPPYEGGQDALFVARSLLWAPRVVALVPLNILCGVDNFITLWRHAVLRRQANLVRRPKFGGDFTAKLDYCVIEAERWTMAMPDGFRRAPQNVETEWWT